MKKKQKATKQQSTSPIINARPPKKRKRVSQAVRLSETGSIKPNSSLIKLNPNLAERILKKGGDNKRRRKSFFKKLRSRIYSAFLRKLKKWKGL